MRCFITNGCWVTMNNFADFDRQPPFVFYSRTVPKLSTEKIVELKEKPKWYSPVLCNGRRGFRTAGGPYTVSLSQRGETYFTAYEKLLYPIQIVDIFIIHTCEKTVVPIWLCRLRKCVRTFGGIVVRHTHTVSPFSVSNTTVRYSFPGLSSVSARLRSLVETGLGENISRFLE